MSYCSNCGAELELLEKFCSECGNPVKKAEKVGSDKRRRKRKNPRKNKALPFILVFFVLFALGGILVFTLLQGSESESNGSYIISGPDEELPAEVIESSDEENPGDSSAGNIINDGTAVQQGDHWSVSFTSAGKIFFGAAGNGNLHVAVGVGGDYESGGSAIIYTSPDGITWTKRYEKAGYRLNSVIWSNNQFVSVGGDYTFNEGPSIILTSPDGINWVERYTGSAFLWDVAWTGNQYVAVAISADMEVENVENANGIILASPDGVSWAKQDTSSLPLLWSINWNGNQFTATGTNSEDTMGIFTSPDGINWTERYIFSGHLHDIAWSGNQYVAVGGNMEDFASVILTSPDGVSWTKQDTRSIPLLTSIDWNGNQFTAVGAGDAIITSFDGFSWKKHKTEVALVLYDIAWNGSQFMAVGYDPASTPKAEGYIMLSK